MAARIMMHGTSVFEIASDIEQYKSYLSWERLIKEDACKWAPSLNFCVKTLWHHRAIQLRHLLDKMRPDLVTFL